MELTKNKLQNLYHDQKFSQREIAQKAGCSRGKVRYRMKKWNIKKRSQKQSLEKKYEEKRIKTNCPVCGEHVEKAKSSIKDDQQEIYCSQKCAYKGRGKYTKMDCEGGYDVKPTILKKTCKECEETFKVELANKNYKYCSRKCFHKSHSDRMSGKGNPMYVDGSSKEKRGYRGEGWKEKRKECYERDGYTCKICNRNCMGRKNINEENSDRLIQCHHITPYNEGGTNDLSNLVTLCVRCHTKIHNGYEVDKDKWKLHRA
jgi:endogenous inhibitor of DNA gyrase (YacG/DUF329 family)